VRARRHLSARALAASLRCCRCLAASLPPRCLAASLTPPYLAQVRTRRTPPVDAHATPSARRRAAIVAVAPKPPRRLTKRAAIVLIIFLGVNLEYIAVLVKY